MLLQWIILLCPKGAIPTWLKIGRDFFVPGSGMIGACDLVAEKPVSEKRTSRDLTLKSAPQLGIGLLRPSESPCGGPERPTVIA